MKTLLIRGTSTKSTAAGKAQFALRVSSGFNQGALLPLTRKRSVLGRSFQASVPLEDDRVSREHAEIILDKGRFYVSDKESTNGTYLNNEVLKGRKELSPGDTIRVGSSVFVFEVFHAKNAALRQKWTNDTSVIPRAHFSFDDLSRIKPDKFLAIKRQFRLAKQAFFHMERMFLRECKFWLIKGELHATRFLHRASKKISSIKFLGQ